MPKLRAEAAQPGNLSVMSSKKAKVDVLSTEDFRMCYFFRRMNQRHAVLLKEHIVLDPRTGQPMREPREDYDAYPQEQPRDATREGGSPEVIRVKEEPVDDDMANVNFGLPTTPVSRVQEQDMNDGIELDEGDEFLVVAAQRDVADASVCPFLHWRRCRVHLQVHMFSSDRQPEHQAGAEQAKTCQHSAERYTEQHVELLKRIHNAVEW